MVDSTPAIPKESLISPATPAIKIATPDLMLINNEQLPIELMTDLVFENIGGQEIISIVRNDLVNGQNILYQPIKNLLDINFQYNSNNILSLENTSDTFFNNFPINLSTHIPIVGTGPSGEYIYINSSNGNLIIDLIGMDIGEQVEVEILTTGTLLDDTIY